MHKFLSALVLAVALGGFASTVAAWPSSVQESSTLSEAEKEFYGAMNIYHGYVGTKPEQIAKMLNLTIIRVEKAQGIEKESLKPNSALLSEIESALDMLKAHQHLSKADAHFAKNETTRGYQELNTACRYADKVPELVDAHVRQICKKGDKSRT